MDAPTSVAILIATYNWPQALQQTLMSVANQTIQPNEVLIADDGSDERTSKLIQAFKLHHPNLNIIHVWHEDNGFRLAAIRNKSIRMAQSDYIIQIDGDIILDQHFIADHLSLKEKGFFVTGSRLLLGKKITDELLDSEKINFEGIKVISDYIYSIISDLNDNGRLNFRKTKNETEEVPSFKVSLGVMPDYMFNKGGMRIDAVTQDRPGYKAGLIKGDIVIKMGEHG